jgi:nucleoside 2-deoxyribosyltransferase
MSVVAVALKVIRDNPVGDNQICYRYFHAGELFNLKHLTGNLDLAHAISNESGGRYMAILPQNLEIDHLRTSAIRDADLLALVSADVALFHFDGPELDSGTVVEFIFAKFADIPAVLLRTDFRRGGDNHSDPWNLMVSDWPRTEKVILNSMELYHATRHKDGERQAEPTVCNVARRVVEAFDNVAQQPPVLPADLREAAYRWLSIAPSFGLIHAEIDARFNDFLKGKIIRQLL